MKGETFLDANTVLMNILALIDPVLWWSSETRPEPQGGNLVSHSQQSISWWQILEYSSFTSDFINEPGPG